MKTAGLTLDFYDDVNGELLKSSFPTPEALPEIIKTAHILSSEEREVLRDEAFALVMVNEGKVFRKFACVDPGNTFLSALYFDQNAESLPEEAQKIAAANILAACEEFGMEIQDLEKMAAAPPRGEGRGAARKRDPMLQPVAGDEANWSERTNLISVRGGADSGRVIPTASQMKTAGFEKEHGIKGKKDEGPGKAIAAGAVGGAVGGGAGASFAADKNIKKVTKTPEFRKAVREDLQGVKDSFKPKPTTNRFQIKMPKLTVNGQTKRQALNAAKEEMRNLTRGARVTIGAGGALGGLALGSALGYGAHKLKKHHDEKKKGEKVNFLDSHHKLNPGSEPKGKVAFTSAELSLVGGALGGTVGGVVGGIRGAKKDAEGKRHIGKGALKGALKGGALGAAPGLGAAAAKGGAAGRGGMAGLKDYAQGFKNIAKRNFVHKKVANIVDVSALEPAVKLKTASAKHTALGHYPLDSFEEVQAAVQYFSDNYLGFTPGQRHEFAVKTASRAEDLGIELPAVLDRYGSNEYAPDVEAHLANRRALAPDHSEIWNALQEKRASISPESFVELLSEADEEAGLNWLYDGQVADPFFATFGGNKVKEANAAWSWQSSVGDYVSAHQLKNLALNGRPLVSKQFDEAFAVAFAKDPITMFESMPDLHKKILARLAAQEHDGLNNN